MKKGMKWMVVLLTVLLCITLLFSCKNNYVYSDGEFSDSTKSDIDEFIEPDIDVITYNNQFHTFSEWCWIFFEDMELYDEFLCYADSEAYAKFKYELLKTGIVSELLDENKDANYMQYDEVRIKLTLLEQRIEYGNVLIFSNSKKGDLIRYYDSKIIDNGFPSVFYRKTEVREYYFNNYLYKTNAEEMGYLPTSYYLIRDMNLKSRTEEFRQENEYRITTTEDITRYFIDWKDFDLLFGDYDEETVKKELKRPTVFYFDGKLYDLEDLQTADSALLNKMGAGAEFKDYLTDLKKMRVFKEAEAEYGELVDGWLEKYYGIKA